ncbi:MAG: FAD-binding oxidoreductase, partial [Planctomycetes bacterium]|nr:FAD-binding oxidoreductase [Planctomycetota bacterium]
MLVEYPHDDASESGDPHWVPPALVAAGIAEEVAALAELHAEAIAARGGRSTVVIDAETPGFGCSTRNGGQISTSVKPSLAKLTARVGAERARAIRQEGRAALEWFGDFVAAERLDCDFRRSGRYHAAHTPQHYEELTRDAERMRREEGIESFAVPRADQRSELGSDSYFGGVVFPKHCSVHPARYHRELLRLALSAGAGIVGNCRATVIDR